MNTLEDLAAKLIADAPDESITKAFHEELKSAADLEKLRKLAEQYTPHSEVSVPIYQRILELKPDDVNAIVALGFIFWLDGEDEQAWRQVESALKLDGDNVEALTLEAALTANPEKKVALYRKILEEDPDNQIAQDNLMQLLENTK